MVVKQIAAFKNNDFTDTLNTRGLDRNILPVFEGLADFLYFLDWACGLANTPERVATLARAFCERLAANARRWQHTIRQIPRA